MDDLSKLITEAQKGDKDAFGEIYNIFYQRIYRFCRFSLKRTEAAEDVCQETFVKAWSSLPSFSQYKGGSYQAYLFKIARNLIIDLSRKKKEFALEEYTFIEDKEDLSEQFDKKQEKQKLKEALNKLTKIERQIIILRYFEELTTAEVARAAGLREGALRVRIHRILIKLEGIIEK